MTFCLKVPISVPFRSSEKGSTLKGKNLLPREKIISFQSKCFFRREAKTIFTELGLIPAESSIILSWRLIMK